jgi:hypothetical protein
MQAVRAVVAPQVWTEWLARQKEKKEEKRHKRERREREKYGKGAEHRRRGHDDADGKGGEEEPDVKRARRSRSHDVTGGAHVDDGAAAAHDADAGGVARVNGHRDEGADVVMYRGSAEAGSDGGGGGGKKKALRGRTGAGDVEEGEL